MIYVLPIVRGNEVIDDSLDVLNVRYSFLRTLLLVRGLVCGCLSPAPTVQTFV